MKAKLLLCGRDSGSTRYMGERLVGWGYDVRIATSGADVLAAMDFFEPDLAVWLLPPGASPEVLDELRELRPREGMPVIVAGELLPVETAVLAMRAGASDVLEVRADGSPLGERLERMTASRTVPATGDDGGVVVRSRAMRRLFGTLRRIAPSSASVLITGESGSGKDFVAQQLHALSDRARGPFVAVSCPAIPEQLLESELFGHHRGSFTGAVMDRAGLFEHAAGGTLFLDEITEMALGLQAKLLRVLESRRFRRVGGSEERLADFRVLAATNRDPLGAVASGHLREDLYYRLNVFQIHVPPLRERREDIAPLAERWVAQHAQENKRPVERLAPDAASALERYDWPGNVRELRNALERAVILAHGHEIRLDDLPAAVQRPRAHRPAGRAGIAALAEVERGAILEAVERCRGNKSHAAKALGISLKTLRAKLRSYGAATAAPAAAAPDDGAGQSGEPAAELPREVEVR